MNPSIRYPILAVALLLGVSLAVGLSARADDPSDKAAPPAPPPAAVSVLAAQHAMFAPLLWAAGNVVSREDARVATEQPGRVTAIADVGTLLRKGETVAQLDASLLQLQERQNQSDISRIQAQLDYANSQEQRLALLVEKASIAGAQLDEARSQRRVLEQDLQRARVALDETRHRLRNATVRAPFNGMVVERYIQAGEYLGVGMAVVRLVNTDALEVRAQAPVNLAGGLAPDMPVTLREGTTEMLQRVRAVVPVGNESSRQFELRIALEGASWPIGSAVQVGLTSAAPREVIAIPRDALLLRGSESFVMRVTGDLTAQRVAVRTGGTQGEWVEVMDETIAAGDQLVVRGAERLSSGQRVRIDPLVADPSALVAAGR